MADDLTFGGVFFAALIASCVGQCMCSEDTAIKNKVNGIETKIDNLSKDIKPKLEQPKIISTQCGDEYVEIDGRKFYYKMDGKPVEGYNKEKE